jgi:hypothetical protein
VCGYGDVYLAVTVQVRSDGAKRVRQRHARTKCKISVARINVQLTVVLQPRGWIITFIHRKIGLPVAVEIGHEAERRVPHLIDDDRGPERAVSVAGNDVEVARCKWT